MIELLDCTIRDGGYINNWDFSQNFGESLYRAASESGCSFVEIGFFAPHSKKSNPWTHCTPELVREIKSAVPDGTGIAVMIDQGSCEVSDLPLPSEYPVDLIRVATPKKDRQAATEFAAALGQMGYKTTVNYMAVTEYSNREILDLVRLIETHKENVAYSYVADSFGSLFPNRARELFGVLRFGTDAALGFHPHNNLQLAFANSLEAIDAGFQIVDGSIFGMGRGAGNLFLEAALAYFEQKWPEQFRLLPVLQFADLFVDAVREKHAWGYSLPQLISGVFSCHPNYPTNLLKEKLYAADEIYFLLQRLDEATRARYSATMLETLKQEYSQKELGEARHAVTPTFEKLVESHDEVLLLAGGPSVLESRPDLQAYIEAKKPAVISINNPSAALPVDALFFANRRRLLQHYSELPTEVPIVLTQAIHGNADVQFGLADVSWVNVASVFDGASPFKTLIPRNSGIEAILAMASCGFRHIKIAGLDGFTGNRAEYYNEALDVAVKAEDAEARNAVIEEELALCQELGQKNGFDFSIVTPTRFSAYYVPLHV